MTSLDISKDGARIVSGGADKTVKVWTLEDGKPAGVVATPAEVRGVGFNADGSRIIAAGADKRARVYNLDGTMLEFFAHDGPAVAAMFQPDGKHIVTASDDKTAKLWTLSLLWQSHQNGPVRQALFTPKGDRVLSCGDDGTARWWNAADGKALKSIPAHEGAVVGVAVSGDGTKFASIGADKSLKVWEAAPGDKEQKEPLTVALAAPASAVTISPDGKHVAASVTNAAGTLLRVFDAVSGKELVSLSDHIGPIRSFVIVPGRQPHPRFGQRPIKPCGFPT